MNLPALVVIKTEVIRRYHHRCQYYTYILHVCDNVIDKKWWRFPSMYLLISAITYEYAFKYRIKRSENMLYHCDKIKHYFYFIMDMHKLNDFMATDYWEQ